MATVITLSRKFLKGHPKVGQPTFFVEKALKSLGVIKENTGIYKGCRFPSGQDLRDLNGPEKYYKACDLIHSLRDFDCNDIQPKHHTIRGGKRFKTGDKISLRVWSDMPYRSPQIIIAPDLELTVKDIEIKGVGGWIWIDGKDNVKPEELAMNDGLSELELAYWFEKKPFSGQLLIWNNTNLPY